MTTSDPTPYTGDGTKRDDPQRSDIGISRQVSAEEGFNSATAMRRLTYLGIGGCVLLLLFSAATRSRFLSSSSISLLIACAATMIGILVGFVFGVPFSRDDATSEKPAKDPSDARQPAATGTSRYKPNTSLEQIADWLTKMIVGVGLVELKNAPPYFWRLSKVLSGGIGDTREAQVLVLTTIVYFTLCGFLFGFLWARLYLGRWFTEADAELVAQKVVSTLSANELRNQADARLKTRISEQLARTPDDPLIEPQEWVELLRPTSTAAKIAAFYSARDASMKWHEDDYSARLKAVVSILNSLVTIDVGEQYHRTHAELSYAFSRLKPPDYEAALGAIEKAIQRRDRLKESGWRYYEFRRAMYRIRLLKEKGVAGDSALVSSIVGDLKTARAAVDLAEWNGWIKDHPVVQEWIRENKIEIT